MQRVSVVQSNAWKWPPLHFVHGEVYIYDFHCTFSDRMCYIAAGQLPWTAWIYLYSVNAHARIHNAFNLCIIMYNVTQNVWTKFYIIQLKQDSEQPLDKPQSTNHRERLSFLVSGRKYVEEASLSGWVASLRVLLRKSQTKDFLWNPSYFSTLLLPSSVVKPAASCRNVWYFK